MTYIISETIYQKSMYANKIVIEAYINNPKLDFLGRNYDKILFEALEGTDPTILDKIKAIPNDIRTMPQQAKAMWKMFHQKPIKAPYFITDTLTVQKNKHQRDVRDALKKTELLSFRDLRE